MSATLANDATDAGASRHCLRERHGKRRLRAPIHAIAVQEFFAGLRLRDGIPIRHDVVEGLVHSWNLDELNRACAPVTLRLDPKMRTLLIEHAVVLIVIEVAVTLHQSEAAR